jgi:cytochrome c oxidase assembly protein Cox11
MNSVRLSKLSSEQLVQLFAELAVEQDMALLSLAQGKVNKLYWRIKAIGEVLKSRPGDQRSALLPLYDHKNMQVRLKAAHATLAIAPEAARAQLEAIAASGWQPQALDAGMSLINLDRGIYKPK